VSVKKVLCFVLLLPLLALAADHGVNLKKRREISFDSVGRAGNWSDFAVSDEGTVYLLDGRDVKVDIFSSAGKLLDTKTYAGQGPGEFVSYPRIHTLGSDFWLCAEGKMARFDANGRLQCERRTKPFQFHQIPISKSTALMVRDEMGNAPKSWLSKLTLLDIDREREMKVLSEGKNLAFLFLKVSYGYVYFGFDGGITPNFFASYAPWRREFVCGLTAGNSLAVYDAKGNEIRTVRIKLAAVEMSEADRQEIVSSLGSINSSQKSELQKMLPKTFTRIKSAHLLDSSWLLIEHPLAAEKSQFLLFSDKGEALGELIFPVSGRITQLKCQRDHVSILAEDDEETRYYEFTFRRQGTLD